MTISNRDRQRLFGTDGIRGRAGEGWMQDGPMSALGKAIGRVLGGLEAKGGRALLGHDGRRSAPEFEAALSRGLAASGMDSTSTGLITTPGLALLTRSKAFDLGIMISASHNPAQDNGIKVFGATGEKLADETEGAIEEAYFDEPDAVQAGPVATYDSGLESAYVDYLCSSVEGLSLEGVRIALDCANGGGSHVGPRVLERLGAEVLPFACSPDGTNINEGCGSTQPEGLQGAVRQHGATLGIALDGDGDRCILVDETGEVVHGDGILTVLARHAQAEGRLPDSKIVATVMSNRGLHRALREVGVGVVTVGVGDRRVVEALRRDHLGLGGEQSGHVVFGPDNHFIGDGLYTALRVLASMRAQDAPLSALVAPFKPFPQVLVNVPVSNKPDFDQVPSLNDAVRRIEDQLGDDGRVLLRYSGTEPLARVMVEGPDDAWIQDQANSLADLIARQLGQDAG